ncbi:MAG: glycerate kinase, partial [Streptococcus salivarius]
AVISAAFPIIGQVLELDQVLATAKENLYRTGLNIGNLIKLSKTL